MIKTVVINRKKVPVPVPIRKLSELIEWIEVDLLQKEDLITRIMMNGVEIETDLIAGITNDLSAETLLEVQIDTPFELLIQSVEAIRNLSSVVLRCTKQVAVELWQLESAKPGSIAGMKVLKQIQIDVNLIIDLVDNAASIDRRYSDALNRLSEFEKPLRASRLSLETYVSHSEWKRCSKVLLNDLEPALNSLVESCLVVENDVFIASSKHGSSLGKF